MNPRAVPEQAPAVVTVTGGLTHLCPHKDETDLGWVTITWRCDGATIELHSLREWLDTYNGSRETHETITSEIATVLSALDGIADVTVSSKFHTAGFETTVESR